MIISEWDINLKNVKVEPLDGVEKIKDITDVMYLYYSLDIKSLENKQTITFNVYEFPLIQNIREIVDRELHLKSQFGLEHSINVTKENKRYTLHLYENFGGSVVLDYLSEEEIYQFVDYVEDELNKAYSSYNNGEMYKEVF